MRRAGCSWAGLTLALGALLVSGPAAAVCEGDAVSDKYLETKAMGASVLSPVATHPTLGYTFVPVSSTLMILRESDLSEVCHVSLDGTIDNTPVPVMAGDGNYGVFVTTLAGSVYRIDKGCAIVWQRNLRRAGCSGDGITASPVVHLRKYASTAFQAKYLTDLVYVGTNYNSATGCLTGYNTENRIYALQSTDGLPVWIFNETATTSVDYFAQAGFLDMENDKLYAGSGRTGGATQHTLWAIDVLTGARAWSANVGALDAMPTVVDDRVYVANSSAQIKALSRLDGAVAWSYTVATGTSISANLFAERRPPYTKLIGAVAANGFVYVLRDDTTAAVKVWGARVVVGSNTYNAVTRAAFDPNSGKLYVGTSAGNVAQMSLEDGTVDTVRSMSGSTNVTGDPSFAFEDTNNDGTFEDVRLIVADETGLLRKFCAPWASSYTRETGNHRNRQCSVDTECPTSGDTTCLVHKCVDRICTYVPRNEGSSCNTGSTFTNPGKCWGGVCRGRSNCETVFNTCSCTESDGSSYDPRVVSAPAQGDNTSSFTMTNACVTSGTNVRTVAVLHLVDDKGRPFTGADVTMSYPATAPSLPLWVDPATDTPLGTNVNSISTNDYVIRSSRPGTYFGILAARPGAVAYNDLTITAAVSLPPCAKRNYTAKLRIAEPGAGGGAFNGGCNLLNEKNESRHLRVQVVREDDNSPLKEAIVMVGYKGDPQKFQKSFENFITSGPGDQPNVGWTDANGYVEFNNLGDNLNGPFIVSAGHKRDGTTEFVTVTLQGIASTDVRMALPVIVPVTPARLEKGDVTKRSNGSVSPNTRMSLVAQKRKLDFFANVDPQRLFDVNECAGSGLVAPENAFLARGATTEDKFWNKDFTPRTGDTLQTSYHRVPTAAAWPTAGEDIDLRGYLLNATYEQLGFYFNLDLVSGTTNGPALELSPTAEAKYFLELRFSADKYWDIVGTSLTDYSRSLTVGRGVGDLFLQGHKAVSWTTNPSLVTVPFFDLDDANLDNGSGTISNLRTWNIAQATGMYLINPPCGASGQDARCYSSDTGVTPAMRGGRTSVMTRVYGSSCVEPWAGTETQTVGVSMGKFPHILDMKYDSGGGGFYRTCPGGRYKTTDGLCCMGTWSGTTCTKGALIGDYQKHVIYLKRTTYRRMGCAIAWQPSVERIPRWVFYTPGNAAMVFMPDLPADFPNACGGVDTSACPQDQRMGLPQRMGSGGSCTSCKTGEVCTDILGVKKCAVKSGDYFYFEDYEWHVDHEAVDLVADTLCRPSTPCGVTTRPVLDLDQGYDFPRFDGTFDFGETPACLTARSSNDMIVN